jgi:hypothetical protein
VLPPAAPRGAPRLPARGRAHLAPRTSRREALRNPVDPLDPEGGQWSLEHGYDGRYRWLFAPDGIPWARLLQSTITRSLTEDIEYPTSAKLVRMPAAGVDRVDGLAQVVG